MKRLILALILLVVFYLGVHTADAQTSTLVLEIESINLHEQVVPMPTEVVDYGGKLFTRPVTPRNEVAWLFTSAVPNVGENIVMFGHDYTVFQDLDEVGVGDVATVYLDGVPYKYLITELRIVPDTNISHEERERIGKLIGPQGKETLTLITCHGRGSPDRLVAIGEPFETP